MCLQSCHRAVITDWPVLVLVLSLSLIKVDMKPQPVQISEPLCSSFCFICNLKTCHRCVWDNSCSSFHCKIKDWASWALWCAVWHYLSPRVHLMNSAGGCPFWPPHPHPKSLFINISFPCQPFFNLHILWELFLRFLFFFCSLVCCFFWSINRC